MTRFRNRKHHLTPPEMVMAQHLHKRSKIVGALLAIVAYPLWWATTKEFCVSQPPTFVILLCAGYGLLSVFDSNRLVSVSGIVNLGIAMVFLIDLIYGKQYKTALPLLIIAICSLLCSIILCRDYFLRGRHSKKRRNG